MESGAPSCKTVFLPPIAVATRAVDPDDIGEVLHRPGTKEKGKVVPSLFGPLSGNEKDLRSYLSLHPIEFGEAQIVANAETDLEPLELNNAWGSAPGIAEIFPSKGKKVNLIVGREDSPSMIEEEKAVVNSLSCESGEATAAGEAMVGDLIPPFLEDFFE